MSINTVSYSGLTTFYNIPYFKPDYGDTGAGTTTAPRVSARAEQRGRNICDNIMNGANRGNLNNDYISCVLNEGTWTLGADSYTLSSLEAYISTIFVNNRGKEISWTGIPTGVSQDLFVGLIEVPRDTFTNSVFLSSKEYGDLRIKVVPTSEAFSSSNYILMAQVLL